MLKDKIAPFEFRIEVKVPHTFLWYNQPRLVVLEHSVPGWVLEHYADEDQVREYLQGCLGAMTTKVVNKIIEELKNAKRN